jgi:DNA-binding Xre family transcriptional regulator
LDKKLEPNESVIMSKVRDKILAFLSIDNRDMGDNLNLADLNRSIFEVEEIRFSNIDNLSEDVDVEFNEIIQLNNLTIRADYLE